MRRLLALLARPLFGDYEFYSIYASSDPHQLIAGSGIRIAAPYELVKASLPGIRDLKSLTGPDNICFVLEENTEIVCACIYSFGADCRDPNAFWPLREREAQLVQITTAPNARNCGHARSLVATSSLIMLNRGFEKLYARIWHGHHASERAFVAAGWRRVAWVVTFETFGVRRRRLRLTLGRGRYARGVPNSASLPT